MFKKYFFWFLIGVLLCFVCGISYYRYAEMHRHQFKVVFLNIGQGDAALIQFESGEKMLVDCGPNRGILSALGRNLPFYDRTVDYVLVTHPDLDHYGGCVDVLKSYKVRKIFVNGDDKKGDPFYVTWKTAALSYDTEIISTTTVFSIASSTIQFFLPDRTLGFKKIDANEDSIVFTLKHAAETFLFTGDMTAEAEELLVGRYCTTTSTPCPFRADVLKVAHHGSDGSSSDLFLSLVKPRIAVISVGPNKYGHPTLRAIKHLERTGAVILRTDQRGDIIEY